MDMDLKKVLTPALAMLALAASAAQAATITVKLSLPSGEASRGLLFAEQPLAEGEQARNVSHGGVFDPASKSVKWGPLAAEGGLVVTFDLIGKAAELSPATLTSASASEELVATTAATSPSGYGEWLLAAYPKNETTARSRGLYFDDDGDSLPNFAEYHLGLDPFSPNRLNDFARFVFHPSGGLTVEVDHRADDDAFHVTLEKVHPAGGSETSLLIGTAINSGESVGVRQFKLGDLSPVFFRLVHQPYPRPAD